MSTNKLLQSLSEDPQLEKQIGCMAGILQLFDRHQVLTGRRLYGHKRIAAAASKTQTPSTSNCGSPISDSSGIVSDNMVRYLSEEQRLKNVPATGIAHPSEQQRSQPPQLPVIRTEMKGSLSYARTPSPTLNEASTEVNSRDQLPKISFDTARNSLLAPRRLDSSRSLHEVRVNVPPESKVFARKSVDTAERAAAAARGALKELSRISTDFTGPNHHEDQVSIREIVRSSLGQEQHASRSTENPLLSGSSSNMQATFPPRMAGVAGMYTPKAGLPKDMSRAHTVEAKSSSECHPLRTSVPQAGKHAEASRPPRHNYKPKTETPTKTCADISESLRLLAKLREASPTYNTPVGHDGAEESKGNKNSSAAYHAPQPARSSVDIAREGPAFSTRVSLQRVSSERAPGRMSSYEPSRASSVDSLLQGGLKVREVPRLSLDGRGVGTGIKADREAAAHGKLHSRSLLSSRSVSCSNSECDTESLHEKRTSFSSNVVAKLMGLDEIPTGDERPHAHQKLALSCSSDQKVARANDTASQDINPTFSQCGKYVSASFFPSKRRNDVKIAIDLEEEEEDSYLQLEPLSHQEARTLNVRVGSLKLHAEDRLVPAENTNHLGPPCYQPKNHHLMEDRPPHVLSPAARICAQIEEMQRADSSFRELDKGSRPLVLQQSSKTELEALKQLLSAIQFKRNSEGSHAEKLQMRGTPRKPQLESGRMPLLHEPHRQAEQPLEVTCNTKKMLNGEFDSQIDDHISNVRRTALESHNRKLRSGNHDEASRPSSRQYTFTDNYNEGPRFQSDANTSPGLSNSSLYKTPRKPTMSNGCITPGGTRNVHTNVTGVRKTVAISHTPPHGKPVRFSTSPRTPLNQQLRSSHNVSGSWEVSSVSSSSSNNVRDHFVVGGNSSHRASIKQNRQSERVEKKKVGIPKDKEESKANLVSMKPNPMKSTEKKAKSGGVLITVRSNSRTSQRSTQTQKSDNSRSNMKSPTKSSAKKATETKRMLNFSTQSGMHPSDLCTEDQEAEFVDKSVVSSTESIPMSKLSVPMSDMYEAGHDVMPEDLCVSVDSHGSNLALPVRSSNTNHSRAEGGATSPLLLLAGADASEARCVGYSDRQATSTVTGMDAEDVSRAICTPTGALRLPQVLSQENEDTESQGDKSTGSCEQPSPISVLEGPFYEDDVASPPTTTKFVLKLKELEEEARGGASAGSSPQHCCPLSQTIGSEQNSSLTDFEYVKHILELSYLGQSNNENSGDVMGAWKLRPLDSHYFLQLEEELASHAGNVAACNSELGSSIWRRKVLFDSVNASLERRLHVWRLCQHQPWLLACEGGLHGTVVSGCSGALRQGIFGVDEENNLCLSKGGGKVLLEEVWEEIEATSAKQRGISSKMCTQGVIESMGPSDCAGGEEEEDGGAFDDVGQMLEEDILGQSQPSGGPDAWDTWLLEKGELGLDLERLIFKDLIDHTIRDLGLLLLPPPPSLTTKRQLFKLH